MLTFLYNKSMLINHNNSKGKINATSFIRGEKISTKVNF